MLLVLRLGLAGFARRRSGEVRHDIARRRSAQTQLAAALTISPPSASSSVPETPCRSRRLHRTGDSSAEAVAPSRRALVTPVVPNDVLHNGYEHLKNLGLIYADASTPIVP